MTQPANYDRISCKGCKWLRSFAGSAWMCNAPKLVAAVPGRLYEFTAAVRKNPELCGPDARWRAHLFKPYKVKPHPSEPGVYLTQIHIANGRYHTISRQPSMERAVAAVERHAARQP